MKNETRTNDFFNRNRVSPLKLFREKVLKGGSSFTDVYLQLAQKMLLIPTQAAMIIDFITFYIKSLHSLFDGNISLNISIEHSRT